MLEPLYQNACKKSRGMVWFWRIVLVFLNFNLRIMLNSFPWNRERVGKASPLLTVGVLMIATFSSLSYAALSAIHERGKRKRKEREESGGVTYEMCGLGSTTSPLDGSM